MRACARGGNGPPLKFHLVLEVPALDQYGDECYSLAQIVPRDAWVSEVETSHTGIERRRSERVMQSLPVIVRGVDLLGQPFEERSSTLDLNLHGCRYASKYHLPRNSWVTLEIVRGTERGNVRARVAWVQRPRSVREMFQIAVELESAGNFWGIETTPVDWHQARAAGYPAESESRTDQLNDPIAEGKPSDMNSGNAEMGFVSEPVFGQEPAIAGDSPLLREWRAEMERHAAFTMEQAAANAIDQIRGKLEEFERERANAGVALTSELASKQRSLLDELRAEIERDLRGVRELAHELDQKAEGLRAESQAALESISRLAQARLQAEALQLQKIEEPANAPSAVVESTADELRVRIESEMALAQAQWAELLQSSLDSSIERVVRGLSGRSQEILRDADQKISDRLADVRQPLAQISSSAQETLAAVKSALDQDLTRARASLAEMEHSVSRMKEYSAQLESTSHSTVNELHGRLENILEAQTDEMKHRVESLLAAAPERLGPSLDSLAHQLAERTIADLDAKIAPRVDRVTETLHALAAREAQTEEELRLHRGRLRQVSEAHQKEAADQMAGTVANLRGEFETARKESLSKWNEELDAAGVRAAHAAAESIGRSSEWFQQEARSRLQVLVEQAVTTAGTGLEEKTAQAGKNFEAQLEEKSNARVAEIQQQLDGVAGEITGRTRSQLEAAAEAAAASFGQVVREVSGRETQQFTEASHRAVGERAGELENLTRERLQKFEVDVGVGMEQLQSRISSELEASVARGRDALAAEFAKAADGFRAEREAREAAWAESAGRIGDEAAGKFQERLQNACDSWAVSSVRRLNEHGQSTVDALVRSADQALRDSFAKVFEGLSEALRERPSSNSGHERGAGFGAPEDSEQQMPPPSSEGASNSANA